MQDRKLIVISIVFLVLILAMFTFYQCPSKPRLESKPLQEEVVSGEKEELPQLKQNKIYKDEAFPTFPQKGIPFEEDPDELEDASQGDKKESPPSF